MRRCNHAALNQRKNMLVPPASPRCRAAGALPQITSATLQLALFMTTGATALGYALGGQLVMSQGLAHGITGMLASPLGLILVDAWVRRSGRASVIMVLGVARNLLGIPLLIAFDGVLGIIDLVCRFPLTPCMHMYRTHNSWAFDPDAFCRVCSAS